MRNSIPWEHMKNNILKDNKLEIVVRVKVLKMTGIDEPKAFDFGEINKEHSDVVLKVGEEKFYLQRGYLAHHCAFFRRYFSRNFKEGQSGLQELELPETDAQDFQHFLEILYGNSNVDELNVEGVLLLADFYDSLYVRGKCESYLMSPSKKLLKKKLELSSRFQLNLLADKCISKMTADEYKLLADDGFLDEANPYMSRAFAKKAKTFF